MAHGLDGSSIFGQPIIVARAKIPLKYTASWDNARPSGHNRGDRDRGSAVGTNFEDMQEELLRKWILGNNDRKVSARTLLFQPASIAKDASAMDTQPFLSSGGQEEVRRIFMNIFTFIGGSQSDSGFIESITSRRRHFTVSHDVQLLASFSYILRIQPHDLAL